MSCNRKLTSRVGSHSWRAGFSTMPTPFIDRTNIVAKYKERKINKNILLFGRDVEADSNSRSNTRLMFDGDLLVHQDLLVCFSPHSPDHMVDKIDE